MKAKRVLGDNGVWITVFEDQVYKLISTVPRGYVTTYKEVSRVLNSCPRAVGQALRKNPFAPRVPCHRVVSATRSLGGYMGSTDLQSEKMEYKKKILQDEGVQFDKEGKIDSQSLYTFIPL